MCFSISVGWDVHSFQAAKMQPSHRTSRGSPMRNPLTSHLLPDMTWPNAVLNIPLNYHPQPTPTRWDANHGSVSLSFRHGSPGKTKDVLGGLQGERDALRPFALKWHCTSLQNRVRIVKCDHLLVARQIANLVLR